MAPCSLASSGGRTFQTLNRSRSFSRARPRRDITVPAGHHRAGGTMQNIGDLVITQAFKFAQHDNLAVLDRELLHSGTHAVALYPGYLRSIWIVAGARPTNGVFLLLVGHF